MSPNHAHRPHLTLHRHRRPTFPHSRTADLAQALQNDLNPQFLFSNGQRRATGLALLLSIHLFLAWSRWRTILLDDPVQHVDDFRTVNLAEVLAQLVASGRQLIVAVEDAAFADLLCRCCRS